ncbi:MAG: 6-phosphogluconolactonase [Gammaproteobacteria bacterium]|nr:6-phosphogluconolactonase [Gammaproteobacteria bacterium]MBT8437870.1 6-phosphogluconolactonase [Gammaproteobacteria bacterium]
MAIIEHKFSDRAELIEALYQVFTTDLQQALDQQSVATLLLSGGSTPAPLYQQLSKADLNWNKINVALVDERWVDADSAASNERLLRETMLTNKAESANFTGMKNDHDTPFDGEAECNSEYATLPSPCTICLLGMGPDGHTASLFPQAEGLAAALDSKQHCAGIRAIKSEVTGDNLERMTMTPWSIMQSQRLILLITGDEKWEVYQQACRAGASADKPISLFIHQDNVPLEVYWAP